MRMRATPAHEIPHSRLVKIIAQDLCSLNIESKKTKSSKSTTILCTTTEDLFRPGIPTSACSHGGFGAGNFRLMAAGMKKRGVRHRDSSQTLQLSVCNEAKLTHAFTEA